VPDAPDTDRWSPTTHALADGTLLEEDGQHILYWGDPSDGLLFVFSADTAEHLNAVVSSFVALANPD
jgi:hypothetical protein